MLHPYELETREDKIQHPGELLEMIPLTHTQVLDVTLIVLQTEFSNVKLLYESMYIKRCSGYGE